MNIRPSIWLKNSLRLFLVPLIFAVALLSAEHSLAQQALDPRFGLVNAFEAPQAAVESGATWELLTLRWDQLQPDGAAQWNASPEVDSWLASVRATGREVVGVLIGTPTWATDGSAGVGVPRGLYLPINDSGNLWAGFVRQTVSYYGARGVNRWVIWEDPDIAPGAAGSQWAGSVEDYYQLVKVAYLVAKQANPNAMIHLGAVSYADPSWFGRFLDVAVDDVTAPANNYYFDVATLRLFFSPDRVYTLTQNHYYLMDQKGVPLKPVWINGTNARPAIDPDAYPPNATFRQHPRVTLEQQAAFIIQAYALGFAAGADRIAVYRLVDNFDEDQGQAFGLLRADGSPRPAYTAYQIAVREFSGFVYARRVVDGTQPLIDYVRLTFPDKVTHVAWARGGATATLIVPARSQQARLLDSLGNEWLVSPVNGEYRVVVGGADCNDPAEGCLIGGMPWLLVEEGVQNPLNETPPPVRVEQGGALPTPDPSMALTATALAAPTATSTPLPTATATSTLTPTATETEAPTATLPSTETASPVPAVEPTITPTAVPSAWEMLGPRGFSAALPFILIGLGMLVIGGAGWYFVAGKRSPAPPPPQEDDQPLPPVEPVEPAPVEEPPDTPTQTKPRRRKRQAKPSDEPMNTNP
jgi:hypothetical protein